MHNLYKILQELDFEKIHYSIAKYQDSTITIHVTVPGQRIEIDVEEDGSILTSVFKGSEGSETGMDIVKRIINENID